jgi:hypothetical protein
VGINPQAIDVGVVLTPDQLGNEPAP